MLKRIWRLFIAVITLGLVNLEKRNATALRQQVIDGQVAKVAKAREGLGEVAGAVRSCTREVSRLEGEIATVTARKQHFLKQVKDADPGSEAAATAKGEALKYHRELATLTEDLNRARAELAAATQEYETSKALIRGAEEDVRAAKKKGKRYERQQKAAERSAQLHKTRTSLQGLGGVGDELADLDAQIEEGIDSLQGAAFVASEMAAEALAERQLDVQIAQAQTDADFEAELAAMEADTSTAGQSKASGETASEAESCCGDCGGSSD